MGAAHEGLEQYDLGLKYFQKSTKLDSMYDEAWFGAGSCLEKQEKWYQALHFFNKAVKLNSLNAEYWKAAAYAEFKIGNTISSISAFEEASHLAPKTPGALNIEGLCATPDHKLLIAFRNPLPQSKALLIPLENPEQVIALHLGSPHRVYMLGFAPGFPFIGGLDAAQFLSAHRNGVAPLRK